MFHKDKKNGNDLLKYSKKYSNIERIPGNTQQLKREALEILSAFQCDNNMNKKDR